MFEKFSLNKLYSRNFIAERMGYKSFQAISKGVVTPKNSNVIVLFVTKEKQSALTQYNDYIDGGLLHWEGENKHGSDKRIVTAKENGEKIFLFYRNRHHSDFLFLGEIFLLRFIEQTTKPSEFVFSFSNLLPNEEPVFYETIDPNSHEFLTLHETEREQIGKTRIGQASFRNELIKYWGKCSVTGVENLEFLTASHIKPWKESNNSERLNPFNGFLLNPALDCAFDKGFISFSNTGKILISPSLNREDANKMAINENLKLRRILPGNQEFLDYHLKNKFNREAKYL